ncbi:nitroreductase/quinone reductase family protein [Mycolicibacterium sp. ND9-15]|uniref:nitroreductase/quinone reductase family protein n=1 Tax=Mycolicibacterium sp. ND9-15 TaxID=3042320 RepID=UPI002DD81F68|nr:nitroreductase/quinone reductase family protein [Mycolicibacterium sp. ND9-15]WSE55184.1 nitroreductase/quinone reductase family protein [Mycolicibacterium sp. ND9-15]
MSDLILAVRDRIRPFNKHVLNPLMLRLAGRRHWYAAVIRYTGRRSGRRYATPVVADRVEDGLIIPLPYGTRVDWLRNVLAAGRATVQVGGQTYDVVEPTIIDAAVAEPQLPARRRRLFQHSHIDKYLKLTTT